jgi:hypothetical protein
MKLCLNQWLYFKEQSSIIFKLIALIFIFFALNEQPRMSHRRYLGCVT